MSHAELIIMGATPAGIAMAVRAAREGIDVLLVHHTQHPGGMLANGLGVWDTRHVGRRAPIYDEVRSEILAYYRNTYGAHSAQFRDASPGEHGHTNGRFEPHVAERVVTELLREPRITLRLGYFPVAVQREGAAIVGVTFREMRGPAEFSASGRVYADCSYEGDLLALAGARYRIGRESSAEHGEPHAGVVFVRHVADAPSRANAEAAQRQAGLRLRPFAGFGVLHPASTGAADRNVQAINYRTILTCDPARAVPVPRPASYDAEMLRELEAGPKIGPLPNGKIGLNRPQLLGIHNAYIEGDWEVRTQVMDAHWAATLALLWHLQHAPDIAADVRDAWRGCGLAADEFADHGHRPYEIYVREGRRLVGRELLTEHDSIPATGIERPRLHRDSIAFTEWYIDSHACTRRRCGDSLEEGKMMLHQLSFPGQVPYRALLPDEIENLIVPVNLSATHVAWNTVRLEPTWMHIAEAAAFAVVQALAHGQPLPEIDVNTLQRTLVAREIPLAFFNDVEPDATCPASVAAHYFAPRGFFPGFDARLDDPLDLATARVWARALRARDAEPTLVALDVAAAAGSRGRAITAQEFERFVAERDAPVHAGAARDEPLTRGAALECLWRKEADAGARGAAERAVTLKPALTSGVAGDAGNGRPRHA